MRLKPLSLILVILFALRMFSLRRPIIHLPHITRIGAAIVVHEISRLPDFVNGRIRKIGADGTNGKSD